MNKEAKIEEVTEPSSVPERVLVEKNKEETVAVKIEEVMKPSYVADEGTVESAPDRSSACCDCSIF